MCFSVGKRKFIERPSITFQEVIVIECFVGARMFKIKLKYVNQL